MRITRIKMKVMVIILKIKIKTMRMIYKDDDGDAGDDCGLDDEDSHGN